MESFKSGRAHTDLSKEYGKFVRIAEDQYRIGNLANAAMAYGVAADKAKAVADASRDIGVTAMYYGLAVSAALMSDEPSRAITLTLFRDIYVAVRDAEYAREDAIAARELTELFSARRSMDEMRPNEMSDGYSKDVVLKMALSRLDRMPDLPEKLKSVLRKWSDRLLLDRTHVDFIEERGYTNYLHSDYSEQRLWGVMVQFRILIDAAERENRSLNDGELAEVRDSFRDLARMWGNEVRSYSKLPAEHWESEQDDLFLMAENVKAIERFIR